MDHVVRAPRAGTVTLLIERNAEGSAGEAVAFVSHARSSTPVVAPVGGTVSRLAVDVEEHVDDGTTLLFVRPL